MQAITCFGPEATEVVPLDPAEPREEDDSVDLAFSALAAPIGCSAVAVETSVNAKIRQLARELARPHAYVGYITFSFWF